MWITKQVSKEDDAHDILHVQVEVPSMRVHRCWMVQNNYLVDNTLF